MSPVALLLHPLPQPLDFVWIVVSVIGEVTSPVDSGVIEFRKVSMDWQPLWEMETH
jgi:hypothetical protein